MMNRRDFLNTSAASVAMLAGSRRAFAAAAGQYDLVIKGGRVVDPTMRLNAVRDVAISGGRIAAIEANINAGGAQIINAGGKIVAPGMIDIHTHAARTKEGPGMCLADGVTGR